MVVEFAGFAKGAARDESTPPAAAREAYRKSRRFIDSVSDLESRNRGLRPRSLRPVQSRFTEDLKGRSPVLFSTLALPLATSVHAAPCRILPSVLQGKRFWHP